MTCWWYVYVPKHRHNLVGKFAATEQEVRAVFGRCAHIYPNGVIIVYKRP